MSLVRGFGRFWWDFVVGDEWRIAIIVAVVTALGVLAAIDGRIRGEVIACGIAAGRHGRRLRRGHRSRQAVAPLVPAAHPPATSRRRNTRYALASATAA